MPTLRRWYRTGVPFSAAVLVIILFVVGLPLLGLAALVLRAGVVVGFGLALVGGIVAYSVSPAFRTWFSAQFEPITFHKGLRLGADVAVHPGHTWARFRRGQAVVGADDLVQASLGPVETVTLPPTGTWICRGQPLFGLRRGDRTVELRAPVSGMVVDHNASVEQRPSLMNTDPYGQGWVVKLRGLDLRRERRRLRAGETARVWFGYEVDRLISALGYFSSDILAGSGLRDNARHSSLHLLWRDSAMLPGIWLLWRQASDFPCFTAVIHRRYRDAVNGLAPQWRFGGPRGESPNPRRSWCSRLRQHFRSRVKRSHRELRFPRAEQACAKNARCIHGCHCRARRLPGGR